MTILFPEQYRPIVIVLRNDRRAFDNSGRVAPTESGAIIFIPYTNTTT